MRPVIAVTCSICDFANSAYSAAVRRAGGEPMPIRPTDDVGSVRTVLTDAQGLLLAGGKDICPSEYAEEMHPECGKVDPDRDNLDRWALQAADEMNMPVLAICRGIQALAAFQGGSLYQDIPSEIEGALPHRQEKSRQTPTHLVEIEPGSLLARIVGEEPLDVNSFHHQAVKDLPPGFRISGRAPDSVIEAIEAKDGRFWLAVQWHPEDMAAEKLRQQKLFNAFVKAARMHRRKLPTP